MNSITEIPIRGETIDLDQFLKLTGVAGSGGQAKYFIGESMVQVNGEVESRRRRKLIIGDSVTVEEEGTYRVVADEPTPEAPD